MVQFFCGAKIFYPSFAKTLNREQDFELIDKMGSYPAFIKGVQNSIVAQLKKA